MTREVGDQNWFEMHAFCVEEDGIMWFDQGRICTKPQYHEEPK